eukprot:NODE_155_length_1968_cov_109.811881_g114_i0.p1 GENE.NODE_155_length_1968_cov_109.811881_g114_i0~~NODE_155_length_1968_cov_109.811881_g114_i0.p1  ORF type:complete len:498 (+),score=228.13 NODE_155_length_1968_cov_109.811881_g114_i0:48-1496(+)
MGDTTNHTNMELAAQLLEDAIADNRINEFMVKALKSKVPDTEAMYQQYESTGFNMFSVMVTRIKTVSCINFDACLTTNYTTELCDCVYKEAATKETPAIYKRKGKCYVCKARTPMHKDKNTEPCYMDILRPSNRNTSVLAADRYRPTIQIHGSLHEPTSVVLTREGYRRLLHDSPIYQDFLKSVMSSRTILYVGFSFTDGYLNEIRSDIMTMKKSSSMLEPLAYAIIPDKRDVHTEYYATHEGVQFLSWDTGKYGFGVMDRYLDCLLRLTDVGAALSSAKVLLFIPDENEDGVEDMNNSDIMSLHLDLLRAQQSPVFQKIKERYFPFQLLKVSTLHEVEAALKKDDFIHSYVIIFCEPAYGPPGPPSIPSLHKELISILWHPFSYLNTAVYPTSLLVLGRNLEPDQPAYERQQLLKKQYESHLHVTFCTTAKEVQRQFSQASTRMHGKQHMPPPTDDAATSIASSDVGDLDDLGDLDALDDD